MRIDEALTLELDESRIVEQASRSLVTEEIHLLLEIAAKIYRFTGSLFSKGLFSRP